MRSQIIVVFIIEHNIAMNLVSLVPWRLYFDGSVCSNGQGIGVVYLSPHGAVFEASCRLEYFCTNNQAEYEALLFGLEMLLDIGATHIEAFGDSLLVVHHMSMDVVCFDESLHIYLDKCLDIISISNFFSIAHIFRHDIEEKMSWHSKHPAIMLIIVYFS